MKILIVVLLAAVLVSLGHALTSMSSGEVGVARAQRMVQALTMRISISVALFALLLMGYHFGWIEPHGVH